MRATKAILEEIRDPSFVARFWSHVRVQHSAKCWPWRASTNPNGYGRMVVRRDGKGVTLLSHRVAWALFHGIEADGSCVLHHCDNRLCCNPHHLFVGSHSDNRQDMWDKGRRGNKRRFHLRPVEVEKIRSMLEAGLCSGVIAQSIGCSRETVNRIRQGRTHRPSE